MYQRTNFPKNRDRYPRTLREAFGPAATWRVAHVVSDRKPAPHLIGFFTRPSVLLVVYAVLVSIALGGWR